MFEIGNSLREARLRQGLEFADVERATKIRPKYLRALEHEQFESLPAQTYVKGFLRTYAEFLGLDGQLYVDEYNSRYVTGEDDAVPFKPRRSYGHRARRRRVESSVVLGALVGIGIVAALVIAAWKSGEPEPTRTAPAAAATREPAEPVLVIRASRGDTRLIVRQGTELGRQLFDGTLERGRDQEFVVGERLWVWIQRPRVVDLSVNGSRQARQMSIVPKAIYVSLRGIRAAPAVR